MSNTHHYTTTITWTGNQGSGTSHYTAYSRDHIVSVKNKADLLASSDPAFRGDPLRYNPEEMLVSALSSCHMLWYLHLCADHGIVVTSYTDIAVGTMREGEAGSEGCFTEVKLHPKVTISNAAKRDLALSLHGQAHKKCFIANSCNFPVSHFPECEIEQSETQND